MPLEDPYRSGSRLECPRCKAGLLDNDGKAMACPKGCGEWLTAEYIGEILPRDTLKNLAAVAWWKHPETACPVCARKAELRAKDGLTYNLCSEHGVWLDANQRSRFEAEFAVDITAHRRFNELVAAITKGGEGAAKEITRRLIDLEQRIAKLEKDRG